MRVDRAPFAPKDPLPDTFLPHPRLNFPWAKGVWAPSPQASAVFHLQTSLPGASRPSITRGRGGSHPRQHKGHRTLGPYAGPSDLMGDVWKELPAVAR